MNEVQPYNIDSFIRIFKDYKIQISLLLVLQVLFICGILISPLITILLLALILVSVWAVKDPINLLCLVVFYSCFTVPKPGRYFGPYFIPLGYDISLIEIIFIGCIVLIFTRMVLTGNLWYKFEKGRYFQLMIIYFLCLFSGIIVGISNNASIFNALVELRFLFYLPLIYILTINVAKSKRDIQKLIISFISGMLIYSVVGFIWHLNYISHGGSLSQPIDIYHSSLLLTFVLFLSIAFYISKDNTLYNFKYNVIFIFLYLYNLLFNFRRAIYLGFVFGLLIVFFALFNKNRSLIRKLIIPAIGILIVLVVIGPRFLSGISERAMSITELEYYGQEGAAGSNFYRLWEMANFMENIKHAPIIGLGAGKDWEIFIPFPQPPLTSDHFHNTHAALWLKYGIYTMLMFLIISIYGCWDCIKRGFKEIDSFMYSTYFACAAYFIGFWIAGLFGDYMYYIRPPFWLGVLFGIASFNLNNKR